ncbi:MAG: haloacid dehalogenase [Proteobacteria bacterium]|nr:MAG: haloacid dehalogenase [Pseudomonadota bacterium]
MPDKVIVRDWRQLQAWLMPRLQKGSVMTVSLDIFDTLLGRIDLPEQVQKATCRELVQHLSQHLGQTYSVDDLLHMRQAIENSLRQQAHAAGKDYECRFSDLVKAWAEQLEPQATEHQLALQDFIIRTEMEMESLALYVKPGVLAFLAWLKDAGIRLLAISDMYLDLELIRKLLADKGLLSWFEHVYVSSEDLHCKYSGRLFASIASEQQLNPATWVHIGDNPVSDRRAACEQGIQGIWLHEKSEHKRLAQQQLSIRMAEQNSIWTGYRFFSMLEQRMQALEADSEDFYFRYGRDVLGSVFSTFMLGLQERLRKKPFEKLFFMARDGYLFQQMYHELAESLDGGYLYLSRKVIAAASTANGLTLEQAQVAFYNPKQQGLLSVCKVYGLSEDLLKPLAKRHGFTDFAEPLHDWQDPRLLAFLADEDVQTCIRPAGLRSRDLLEAYLEQSGFFAASCIAMVDIGWNGTVQKFLKQAFGHRADYPIVQGYYFAFVPKMYNDFGKHNFCEGIIHDSRRDNACERIPAEFEEIFEQGARALEATTVGYQAIEGIIEPILKSSNAPDRMAEIACNRMVAAIQAGVMVHWRHFRVVQRLSAYHSSDLLSYVYGVLERAVVYPTREETRMLTRLAHTEDFGHDHVLELGRHAIGWRDLLRPRQLWMRFQHAAWRYALLANIPTGFANFAFRMAYLHAVKK